MNKYTELSDFEINKKVALHVGGFALSLTVVDDGYKTEGNRGNFDPCNNPADAMPIIIENKIALVPQVSGNLWICSYYPFYVTTNNPCRAAMEVLLMMKDAENEG
ncbi:DUF2591 domain-containing protein [Proteus vulgaris]|uniref:DUF2591 domain-containing protein n=1 Tax=Proteus vulgaris TaxID=585 RepID=UPI0021B108E0|nr:DUF2591 domain-containing protein [Proteus vulgaris]MCT6518233.1 DUF2591 domain-containing protein [Proteus vulgaris]